MLDDDELVSALRGATTWRRPGSADDALDYRLSDIRTTSGWVDLCLVQRSGESARLKIALPSSRAPQYWSYSPPLDAAEWLGQLLVWIDEEVFTLGLGTSRVREQHDGASYVVVTNYGWQLSDTARHEHLTVAAGPDGWYGDQSGR